MQKNKLENPLVKFLGEFTKQVLDKQDQTIKRLDKMIEVFKPKKHPVKEKQTKKGGA